MKRFFVVLSVGVITLAAVEWETEQVIDPSGLSAQLSILTLDKVGIPHILYYANDAAQEVNILKFARHVGENWQIQDVDSIPQHMNLTFSFDFNPQNEAVIAYTDSVPAGNLDIILAMEGELTFNFVNLTDDAFLQIDPVVLVDSEGVIKLLYREQNDDGFNIRYGWYDGEDFFSESIRDSMGSHLLGFDFVLDADDQPHVFYSGDDGDLWYATRAGANDWTNTSLEITGDQPSVAMDRDGFFHIGCEATTSIYYVTNASGSWVEEMAQEGSGDSAWIYPSLALDPEGIPHMTWYTWYAPYTVETPAAMEVWYASRIGGSWDEGTPLPPDMDKLFGYVNPFRIDDEGYGHVCFTVGGDLYYVTSTEPLNSGISEIPADSRQISLIVTGSTLRFNLPQPGYVSLNLYDPSGRKVEALNQGYLSRGRHQVSLNTHELAQGVYMVRIETGSQSTGAKVIVIR